MASSCKLKYNTDLHKEGIKRRFREIKNSADKIRSKFFKSLKEIMDIVGNLTKIIVEQLGVKPEDVNLEADFVEDLGADSLDTVELLIAFEEEFGLEIADEDAERMKKVKDVIGYLEKRLGNTG